ncbi:MAG: glycosyltransferase family 4 protein [Methylophilaceae bacterium]|nr:glycosyltransferase family 4 protein [Methylophilaceae bacterium]
MTNLLSINNYHYRRGGSDVVYLEHAELMESQGFSNAFFSMHHPKNFPTPWSEYFIDEIEFGHAYSLADKLSMASKVVYSFEAQRKLKRLIQDFQPDVAHLHCIYHHLSPAILPVLKAAGIPTVMTAHDLKIACPAYKMLNSQGICERCNHGSVLNVIKHRCVKDSLAASVIVAVESGLHRYLDTYRKHLDRVAVPSRFFLEKFVEWGWPREKLIYIPNYVDVSKFEPLYQPGNYLLYFGRLAPEKGVGTLIRAAAKAGVPLKIVGTGPVEAEVKAISAQVGGEADFLGYRTGNELHDLVRGARAVVLPSEWYENAPMSVLESYALGKPVIGARIGGIPEMIVENETGWTFESQNVDDLAACLQAVMAADDAVIARMGQAGRDYVEKTFSRQRYVDSMLALYRELGVKA